MDDTIITIYCLCEEFLEAIGHRDDPQVRLSTAEVMTVPLVSAAYFSGNIDKTRLFLHEYGYMKEMISKKLSLGADVLEEHHQLQAKENHRIDAWAARRSVAVLHEISNK